MAITTKKRKHSLEGLSREKYFSLIEHAADGIAIIQDGVFKMVNTALIRIAGYDKRELLGMPFTKLLTPPSQKLAKARYQARLAGKKVPSVYEVKALTKTGETRDIEINAALTEYDGRAADEVIIRDITERKRAEESLQLQTAYFQQLFDNSPEAIVLLDDKNRIFKTNHGFETLYGYTMEEVTGRAITEVIVPKDRIKEASALGSALLNNEAGRRDTVRKRKDGSLVDVSLLTYPIRLGKRAVGAYVVYTDITERKRAEEALQAEKNKLQSLIDAIENGLNIMDKDYNIIFQNELLKRLYGDRTGEKCYRVYEASEDICDGCPVKKAFKDGESHTSERKIIAPSGEIAFWENTANPIRDAGGNIVSCLEVTRNITERKKIEEELQESHRFSANLLQNSPNPIFVANPDTSVRYVNPAFEKLTGFTLTEILGRKTPYPWWPEEYREEMKTTFRNAMVTGGRKTERIFQKKNGERFWVALNSAPIMHKGKLFYFLINWIDITERKLAEEALADEATRRRILVDQSRDGIVILDQNGNVYEANRQFAEMLGYTPEETAKLHVWDWEVLASREQVLGMLKSVDEAGDHFETRHRRKDGSTYDVEISTNGAVIAGQKLIFCVCRDITQRKQMEAALRESEEKFSKAFHASPDAIAITRLSDGLFIEVNDNFTRITGYTREEAINHKANELGIWARAKDRDRMVKILEKEGRVQNEEFEFRMKSGELRLWLFSGERIDIGGESCLISMTIDITERKRAEEALKEKMEELRIAYEKLKELDQLKDNFLSTVSHELRTPLTSIKSFSEILLTYDEDRETQKEFLNIIMEESDRLTRLINDFLDLSKIESGRMQWETVELSVPEVIKTAMNATQALAAKNNLEVKVEVSPNLPTIMCDRDRLVQVVTNLLSNAIKFTPEEGKIEVKARMCERGKSGEKADMVLVSVTDSGIGIDPKDQKSIFEKFKQVGDTLTDKPKGTGLGLPICKEIIEHYGGRLWVESKLGKGSTFFFTLPLAPAAEAEATEAGEREEAAIPGDKTILVVDDEANIRRFLSHELKKRGYSVIQAAGGNEAIELARKRHPSLITLDVLMGGMSGFDVTAVLKNDPDTKDIPILIVSVVEDKKRAYKLGANDYLTKPFKIETLVSKVNQLLRDAQKKILVVDDDKNLTRSLKYQLGKRGYSASVAYNGKLALEKLESHPPDLILLDIKMPGMDGYEVMKALKHKPETAQIPILVMTGFEIDGSRVKALSVGATDYFTKSGGFGKMFETIDNILGKKSDA
jgi:PAS domain S-box-containing protein